MSNDRFIQVMDNEPIRGHLFSTLKMRHDETWLPIERRCVLCNKLPIQLITIGEDTMQCEGIIND